MPDSWHAIKITCASFCAHAVGVLDPESQLRVKLGWDAMGWNGLGCDAMGWDGSSWPPGFALISVQFGSVCLPRFSDCAQYFVRFIYYALGFYFILVSFLRLAVYSN